MANMCYFTLVFAAISTGKYWDKVDEQWKRKPNSIMLVDKNAPNEEVWLRVTYFLVDLSYWTA